jgi:uncharacterized membrane protein YczE
MFHPKISSYLGRLAILVLGLLLFSFGVILTMKANLGYAPWDVFHWGLGRALDVSIGTASIGVGLALCVAVVLLGEKLGIGTILNMVLIGVFLDGFLLLDLVPLARGLPMGILMITIGLFTVSLGSYFYIKSAFGAGPRDSLMVAVRRLTRLPVGLCRALIEGSVVLIGWFLGGPVGVGTVISALGIGVCIQIVFALLRFEPAKIRHETFDMTWKALRGTP